MRLAFFFSLSKGQFMTNQTSQRWTMLAYALAIIAGVGNGLWGTEGLLAVADFTSSIFIRLFKFISVPIIAVSIIATLSQVWLASIRLLESANLVALLATTHSHCLAQKSLRGYICQTPIASTLR